MYRWLAVGLMSLIPAGERYALGGADVATGRPEPNAAIATTWWPPQRNVWTPIGWKDHLFRFNVVYNGTVVAQPHVRKSKRHTAVYAGQGVQLTITPSADGKLPEKPRREPYQLSSTPDGGVGRQGWADHATPVLWTEWLLPQGVVLGEEVFAHLPGNGQIETGIEPLYAWIRLSVRHVDEFRAPEDFSFLIHVGAPHLSRGMAQERNLTVRPNRSPYPRGFKTETGSSGRRVAMVEPDGRIRLVGVANDASVFSSKSTQFDADREVSYLIVTLPAREGAYADLLLPMIPAERDDIDEELTLGFDQALAGADRYWSARPATAAHVDTPEPQINDAIAHSVKLTELITERNPETGERSFVSGSWQYDALWPTPTSMASHMLLDLLGYHQVVEEHIELFRANQGTVKPPGPSYELHPGYFSSPKTLTSIDWLSDHGAILHQVAKHALLTGDEAFIERWLAPIVKACAFIRYARAIEDHDGVPGVLPPAVATDRRVPNQSVWSLGWNYKGLCTAVRLLERINHPQADAFAAEAHDYRESFVQALRKATAKMPTWTDGSGRAYPVVAHSLSAGGDILHPFYLDTGPMFLVWSGLLNADDELMQASIAFFREGPNTHLYDPRGNFHQRPVLVHEISSCEPPYSWNVYHSWQLGDRYRYLEGMYSLLTGALSQQTYVSCETRHGIYGNVFTNPVLVDLVRFSVIDDVIAEHELHLLRLVPKAWLRTDHLTRFENMATQFGPLTIRFRLTEEGKSLELAYEPRFRHPPKKTVLHVPPIPTLSRVVVNGKVVDAAPGTVLSLSKE